MLAQAMGAEAEAFVAVMEGCAAADGRARVVRHGHGPERTIQTGIGPVAVRRAKVRDRGDAGATGERIRFTSAILPKWARRTKSLDALLPVLYLRGHLDRRLPGGARGTARQGRAEPVAGGDRAPEGGVAGGIRRAGSSATSRRGATSTSGPTGSTCRRGWRPHAECMLVIIGATPEGRKELVGFQVGVRESAQSWRELLVDLKARGLAVAPELAIGDGALGFWKALEEVFPATRHQRCWVHKTANVLNKVPKSVQPAMKADLREVWTARRPGGGRGRHRRFRREVRRQIRQGGHMPDQGPRGAAGLLRLPGRALGSPAHVEPDRERLRHRPASNRADQGCAVAKHRPAHGLQARHRRLENLASAEGRKPVAEGRPRRQVQQRRRGHRDDGQHAA